jgi:hypothetical protein
VPRRIYNAGYLWEMQYQSILDGYVNRLFWFCILFTLCNLVDRQIQTDPAMPQLNCPRRKWKHWRQGMRYWRDCLEGWQMKEFYGHFEALLSWCASRGERNRR